MPFGIASALEVFQRKMQELIEGLMGIKTVADDSIAEGHGETFKEATKDHDKTLLEFLKRCEKKDPSESREAKVTTIASAVIGHMAKDQRFKVDPAKVRAVVEMPPPTDKQDAQGLLGLAQYSAKFLPHFSEITKPLRELTQSKTLWVWEEAQQTVFKKLKEMVTHTPDPRYYNLKGEVTLQCDTPPGRRLPTAAIVSN